MHGLPFIYRGRPIELPPPLFLSALNWVPLALALRSFFLPCSLCLHARKMDNKVIVIIGSGGMWLACARRIGRERTIILTDYSQEALSGALDALVPIGLNIISHVVDISNSLSVKNLVEFATSKGNVEAVIHTAGVSPTAAMTRLYDVNLVGTAIVIDAFAPIMSRGSSLVCVASMAGHFASLSPSLERHLATSSTEQLLQHPELNMNSSTSEAYIVSKRANMLRVQAATRKWGRNGPRLNTISPGVISTTAGCHELDNSPGAKAMVEFSAVHRPGSADEVANVMSFLLGPESSFITGSDILVDGGAVASRRWADI